MKKKNILLSIVAFFIMFMFVLNVDAAGVPPLFDIDLSGKKPDPVPATNITLKATTTNGFDFSKVQFKGGFTGRGGQPGDGIRKIIIGQAKSNTNAYHSDTATNSDDRATAAFSNWFTAYCLDSSKDYPYYGIYSNEDLNYDLSDTTLSLDDKQIIVQQVGRMAAINYPGFSGIFNGEKIVQVYFRREDCSDSSATTSEARKLVSNTVADEVISKLNSGQKFTLNISGVTVAGENGFITYRASEDLPVPSGVTPRLIPGVQNQDSVAIETNFSELAFHDYTSTKPTTGEIPNYNQALWIVEHTYPTLDLDTALAQAGVDKSALETDIKRLYSIENNETAKLAEYTENAVYATIQYAIWKVTGYNIDNHQLPGETTDKNITNADSLNTLYTYLINDAKNAPSNYSNPGTFTNSILVNKPADGKEFYKDSSDKKYSIYGPFTATYNALSNDPMNIEIVNKKDGMTLLDESGAVITKIGSGKKFYVQIDKKLIENKSIDKVEFRLSLSGVVTFKPETDRGRIYYPVSAPKNFQNAMSGGKLETISLETNSSFKILTNPKTGVENIALLLMITLVAFTLGYLVLSYKSNPIQLNQ